MVGVNRTILSSVGAFTPKLGTVFSVFGAGLCFFLVDGASQGLAIVGLLGVGAGSLTGRRRVLGVGVVILLGSVFFDALVGEYQSGLNAAIAVLGAILSWDLGEHSITLREQLGTKAPTARAELAHAMVSLMFGTGIIMLLVVVGDLAIVGPWVFLDGVLILFAAAATLAFRDQSLS